MEAFRDHMQRPFAQDTAEDKLETFRVLIDRLNDADRRVEGIRTIEPFSFIEAKVEDAVAAAYARASNLGPWANTVLQAVFGHANNVTVADTDCENLVEVSMDFKPSENGDTVGHARLWVEYTSTSNPLLNNFKSLSVEHPERPDSDGLFFSVNDGDVSHVLGFTADGTLDADTMADPSLASASQLLAWIRQACGHLELRSGPNDVISTLSFLILRSGLFSDLGTATMCRASFTDAALR